MLTLSPLSKDPWAAIETAADYAPYLRRLKDRLWEEVQGQTPDALFQDSLNLCNSDGIAPDKDIRKELRIAKKKAHFAIAAMDLSGQSSLLDVTRRLSLFADTATEAVLRATLGEHGHDVGGLVIMALGKMGANELNYSSDIDLAAFVDTERFDGGARGPVDGASRIIRDAMDILHARTPEGYVFRTDLRLRPDPSSTPLAVALSRAEVYYESVGQNWERMVWIKGRPCAGDLPLGERFLNMLKPFVWRRHLDYWAIADVHAIKNMINAKIKGPELDDPAPDVKLGPGGIREIEFFAQTQQIILGGRNESLRARGTLDALQALTELGVVSQGTTQDLSAAYILLRGVEHRLQMLEDEQTHTLPSFEMQRASVAALCGYSELDRFDRELSELRILVHGHYQALFAEETRRREAAVEGNLVFTGVDDDPGTVYTLRAFGFSDPSSVIERIRRWHHGHTPATRTVRGRELLTALLPDLLSAMGETGEPDQAFARFSRFFEGLRSGVQTLSMLTAEQDLMKDLVATLALAPRIADTLAKRPGLLEALLSVSDRKEAPKLGPDTDFETAMDLTRRWHGEHAFLIGHRLLHAKLNAEDAATAWTELAESCIHLMSEAALRETVRRYGPAPGLWCIAGLGKLGGRDMTAGSDLDLLVIYDAAGASDAQTWFTRFTQRLITALSAETAEGLLYEVDMRLRPSGRAGPVATSFTSFERYHKTEAWTWEHMALTRLRPIAGDMGLGKRIIGCIEDVIARGDPEARRRDILNMRARLVRDKPSLGPWDLKMRRGGLIDLEFIIQHGLLTLGRAQPHQSELIEALNNLQSADFLTDDEYELLLKAYRFLQSLQQVQRLALGGPEQGELISRGLAERFCRATSIQPFSAVEAELEHLSGTLLNMFCEKIGDTATEV